MTEVQEQEEIFPENVPSIFPSVLQESKCEICQNGEDEDLLLLCDSPGCKNECHMFCLQPRLLHIPEGEWICPSCTTSTSIDCMEEYFRSRQSKFDNEGILTSIQYKSWLAIIQQENYTFSDWSKEITPNFVESEFDEENQCLIGMIVTISFSQDSSLAFNGRIIGKRLDSNLQRTEHLVQFKSGIDGRNAPLLLWIALNEHACVVSGEVVHARRLSGRPALPAQKLYRSGIELIRQRLVNKETQLSKAKNTISKKFLVSFFDDEDRCAFNASAVLPFLRDSLPQHILNNRRQCVAYALATIEYEEQEAVRRAVTHLSLDQLENIGCIVDGWTTKALQCYSLECSAYIDSLLAASNSTTAFSSSYSALVNDPAVAVIPVGNMMSGVSGCVYGRQMDADARAIVPPFVDPTTGPSVAAVSTSSMMIYELDRSLSNALDVSYPDAEMSRDVQRNEFFAQVEIQRDDMLKKEECYKNESPASVEIDQKSNNLCVLNCDANITVERSGDLAAGAADGSNVASESVAVLKQDEPLEPFDSNAVVSSSGSVAVESVPNESSESSNMNRESDISEAACIEASLNDPMVEIYNEKTEGVVHGNAVENTTGSDQESNGDQNLPVEGASHEEADRSLKSLTSTHKKRKKGGSSKIKFSSKKAKNITTDTADTKSPQLIELERLAFEQEKAELRSRFSFLQCLEMSTAVRLSDALVTRDLLGVDASFVCEQTGWAYASVAVADKRRNRFTLKFALADVARGAVDNASVGLESCRVFLEHVDVASEATRSLNCPEKGSNTGLLNTMGFTTPLQMSPFSTFGRQAFELYATQKRAEREKLAATEAAAAAILKKKKQRRKRLNCDEGFDQRDSGDYPLSAGNGSDSVAVNIGKEAVLPDGEALEHEEELVVYSSQGRRKRRVSRAALSSDYILTDNTESRSSPRNNANTSPKPTSSVVAHLLEDDDDEGTLMEVDLISKKYHLMKLTKLRRTTWMGLVVARKTDGVLGRVAEVGRGAVLIQTLSGPMKVNPQILEVISDSSRVYREFAEAEAGLESANSADKKRDCRNIVGHAAPMSDFVSREIIGLDALESDDFFGDFDLFNEQEGQALRGGGEHDLDYSSIFSEDKTGVDDRSRGEKSKSGNIESRRPDEGVRYVNVTTSDGEVLRVIDRRDDDNSSSRHITACPPPPPQHAASISKSLKPSIMPMLAMNRRPHGRVFDGRDVRDTKPIRVKERLRPGVAPPLQSSQGKTVVGVGVPRGGGDPQKSNQGHNHPSIIPGRDLGKFSRSDVKVNGDSLRSGRDGTISDGFSSQNQQSVSASAPVAVAKPFLVAKVDDFYSNIAVAASSSSSVPTAAAVGSIQRKNANGNDAAIVGSISTEISPRLSHTGGSAVDATRMTYHVGDGFDYGELARLLMTKGRVPESDRQRMFMNAVRTQPTKDFSQVQVCAYYNTLQGCDFPARLIEISPQIQRFRGGPDKCLACVHGLHSEPLQVCEFRQMVSSMKNPDFLFISRRSRSGDEVDAVQHTSALDVNTPLGILEDFSQKLLMGPIEDIALQLPKGLRPRNRPRPHTIGIKPGSSMTTEISAVSSNVRGATHAVEIHDCLICREGFTGRKISLLAGHRTFEHQSWSTSQDASTQCARAISGGILDDDLFDVICHELSGCGSRVEDARQIIRRHFARLCKPSARAIALIADSINPPKGSSVPVSSSVACLYCGFSDHAVDACSYTYRTRKGVILNFKLLASLPPADSVKIMLSAGRNGCLRNMSPQRISDMITKLHQLHDIYNRDPHSQNVESFKKSVNLCLNSLNALYSSISASNNKVPRGDVDIARPLIPQGSPVNKPQDLPSMQHSQPPVNEIEYDSLCDLAFWEAVSEEPPHSEQVNTVTGTYLNSYPQSSVQLAEPIAESIQVQVEQVAVLAPSPSLTAASNADAEYSNASAAPLLASLDSAASSGQSNAPITGDSNGIPKLAAPELVSIASAVSISVSATTSLSTDIEEGEVEEDECDGITNNTLPVNSSGVSSPVNISLGGDKHLVGNGRQADLYDPTHNDGPTFLSSHYAPTSECASMPSAVLAAPEQQHLPPYDDIYEPCMPQHDLESRPVQLPIHPPIFQAPSASIPQFMILEPMTSMMHMGPPQLRPCDTVDNNADMLPFDRMRESHYGPSQSLHQLHPHILFPPPNSGAYATDTMQYYEHGSNALNFNLAEQPELHFSRNERGYNTEDYSDYNNASTRFNGQRQPPLHPCPPAAGDGYDVRLGEEYQDCNAAASRVHHPRRRSRFSSVEGSMVNVNPVGPVEAASVFLPGVNNVLTAGNFYSGDGRNDGNLRPDHNFHSRVEDGQFHHDPHRGLKISSVLNGYDHEVSSSCSDSHSISTAGDRWLPPSMHRTLTRDNVESRIRADRSVLARGDTASVGSGYAVTHSQAFDSTMEHLRSDDDACRKDSSASANAWRSPHSSEYERAGRELVSNRRFLSSRDSSHTSSRRVGSRFTKG